MSDMYDDEEFYHEDDSEDFVGGPGFTVAMKGAPNMACVQWVATPDAAIKRTAREWGCKPEVLYIYRGVDE